MLDNQAPPDGCCPDSSRLGPLLLRRVRTGVEGNNPWRLNALTAEAVMRDYESAAKEIEAMGAELISAAKKWEAMTANVRSTIRDTAEAYRQEGEKSFELIDKCALYTEDVRKTCEVLKGGMIEGNGDAQ